MSTPIAIVQDKNGLQTEFDGRAANPAQSYGYLVSIDAEHHKIHEGAHFTCQDYDSSVDTGSPKYWHVKTPDNTTDYHYVFKVVMSDSGLVEMFEAPTLTNDGTQLSCWNNDRKSATTSTMLFYYDPTVSVDGDRILVNVIGTDGAGASGGAGGVESRSREFILDNDTSYLIKATPETNGTRISCCSEHYEV